MAGGGYRPLLPEDRRPGLQPKLPEHVRQVQLVSSVRVSNGLEAVADSNSTRSTYYPAPRIENHERGSIFIQVGFAPEADSTLAYTMDYQYCHDMLHVPLDQYVARTHRDSPNLRTAVQATSTPLTSQQLRPRRRQRQTRRRPLQQPKRGQ